MTFIRTSQSNQPAGRDSLARFFAYALCGAAFVALLLAMLTFYTNAAREVKKADRRDIFKQQLELIERKYK